jgi:hypothetical protein
VRIPLGKCPPRKPKIFEYNIKLYDCPVGWEADGDTVGSCTIVVFGIFSGEHSGSTT